MIPANQRLTQDRDFKRINSLGKAYFCQLFRIKILPNQRPVSRLAVVVSTKVSKKATLRNRLKRQFREIIRLNREKIKTGYDIILSPNNQALGHKYADLEENFLALLNKARLLQ
ncbi:MAG: ribonuclease P protein component [Candidatus Buchananbacteria bacterium]